VRDDGVTRPSTSCRSGDGAIDPPPSVFTPLVTTMAYCVFGSSMYDSAGMTASVSGSQYSPTACCQKTCARWR